MSSLAAARCRHIKVNGTQCGSPALRHKNFCFYHQQNRPALTDCYYNPDEYPTGLISLPVFEDAHAIQTVIRQVVQNVLQKSLAPKTAGLVLYALQIASSNLKRMELEKPQPEQVVTDLVRESETEALMAAPAQLEDEPARETNEAVKRNKNENEIENEIVEELPPGTIQACYRPYNPLRPMFREHEEADKSVPPAGSGQAQPQSNPQYIFSHRSRTASHV
jgi:hypothetical protein